MKLNGWQIAVLVVVAVLIFKPDILSGFLKGTTGAGAGDGTVIVNPTPTSKTVTLSLKDKYNIATTPNDNIKTYKGGLIVSSAYVSGSAPTFDKGDVVTFYASENSTTYYTNKVDYTVKDTLNQELQLDVCLMDTAPSTYWTNEKGTANYNITIGTGGVRDFKVTLEPTAYRCFGNPQIAKSAGVAVKYNISTYSSIVVADATSISCPNYLNTTTGFSYSCYEFDPVENAKGTEKTFTAQALSTVNPGIDMCTAINLTFMDKDYDFNAITDAEIQGFQDENNNKLGLTAGNMPVLSIGTI